MVEIISNKLSGNASRDLNNTTLNDNYFEVKRHMACCATLQRDRQNP